MKIYNISWSINDMYTTNKCLSNAHGKKRKPTHRTIENTDDKAA